MSWVVYASVGVGSFVLSLAVAIMVLVRLPVRYFASGPRESLLAGYPVWARRLGVVGKNVAGVLLVLLGIVLSVPGVPGQGLITILVGVVLLDIPGKRALERRIMRIRAVQRGIDKLRRRFGREPFELDGHDPAR